LCYHGEMDLIYPPALQKGDTIGIVAPSSFIESDKLDIGVAALRSHGFEVKIHPQTLARENQSAGGVAEKVSAFHEMILDSSVKAIMAAGGGNRSAHILDSLDYDLIRANPKIYIGFSDSTALLSAISSRSGLACMHGPMVKTLAHTDRECVEFMFQVLSGKTPHFPFEAAKGIKEGSATGRLIGGNLGTFCSLVGTPYMPPTAGAILFLEDINEELSRVDRMLWHLRKAIPFSKLSGIIFGQFMNMQDTGRPFGYSLDDILHEHTSDLSIPVVTNAPFGHGPALYPLPVGCLGTLDVAATDVGFRLETSPVTA